MSMINGRIICMSNTGTLERGWIVPNKTWYTIDRIIVKTVDGKRYNRHAVCVNGRWRTNQMMTIREAREEVERLKDEANAAQYYAMYI